MSVFACDWHGQRVPGRLETAYPSLVRGGARFTHHLRLCPQHMDDLLAWPGLKAIEDFTDEQPYNNDACGTCGKVQPSSSLIDPLFLTVYRDRGDRQDFFLRACQRCGDDLVDRWKLAL